MKIKGIYLLLISIFILSSCSKHEEINQVDKSSDYVKEQAQVQAIQEENQAIQEENETIQEENETVEIDKSEKNKQQIDQDIIDFTRLINRDNPIPQNYEFDLAYFDDDVQVDARIVDDLKDMFNDMENEGLNPTITYGYRKHETQQELFEQGINKRMKQGMSYEEAYDATSFTTAVPGTSEHEVGLAVDIKEKNGYQDYRLENIYDWLRKNAHKYGFILRYDYDKTEITGIMYEPWHYRYVGKEEAEKIKNSGLALEEYFK